MTDVADLLLVSDERASAVVLLADGRHRAADRLTAFAAERERNAASL